MPKITLKRVTDANGTVASLYPTTTVDQIFTINSSGDPTTTTLDTHLTNTYMPLTDRGASNGVASLVGGKVPESQLPSSVFGGMRLIDVIQSGDTLTAEALMDLAQTYVSNNGGTLEGSYFIVGGDTSGSITVTGGADSNNGVTHTFNAEQTTQVAEENDNGFPIDLEMGDWLVMGGQWSITQNEGTTTYQRWGVVNNTYQDAVGGTKGVVQLIAAANAGSYSNPSNMVGLTDGSNRVVTENFLYDNRISGELNSGTDSNGDADGSNQTSTKLAMSDHIHDGRYYTETEIASFFSGGTSITGYNNDNWDDAYSGEITGLSFGSSTITLTRGNGSETALTASLDGESIDIGTGRLTTDGIIFHNDLDGTNESPRNGLVEYDNEVAVEEYTGPNAGQTAYYPVLHTNNLVAKATAADFEKIFYLASTDTNSDQTVGSIIIQED